MSSDNTGIIILFIILGFFILAIVFFVLIAKRSGERSRQSELFVNRIMAQLPADKQMLFMMQYQNVKKNPTTAVLLALFLGGIGIHKFYLNQVGAGIVYLLFCWTCIPEIIAFIEAFTISGTVGEYNEKKATEIAVMLGGQIR